MLPPVTKRSILPSLIASPIDADPRVKTSEDDGDVSGSAAVPEVQGAWLGDASRRDASSDADRLALHQLPIRMVSRSAQTPRLHAAACALTPTSSH